MPHTLAPRAGCLDYLKVMSEKDGSWHGIKADVLRIKYSIFSILIPKSVVVFFTLAPTSFDDTDLIIAWL